MTNRFPHDIPRRIGPVLAALMGLLPLFGLPENQAHAETWAFRRSYFSHLPAEQWDDPTLPVSRTPYRLPYKDTTPGFYVRSSGRFNSIILRNGNSVDRTWRGEGYIELVR